GLRERLSTALTNLERAQRSGDPDEIGFCEHKVDQCVEAARAAREAAQEPPRNPDGTYAGTFDGGVRRSASKPTPGGAQESSSDLFRRMLGAHRNEQRDLQQDHVIDTPGVRSTLHDHI